MVRIGDCGPHPCSNAYHCSAGVAVGHLAERLVPMEDPDGDSFELTTVELPRFDGHLRIAS